MAQSYSQETIEYSYSIASRRTFSDKTYSGSNKCDRDTSGFSDISDTELSQACDVLLQQTHGLADRHVVSFSDISDTELSAATQALEDSCVRQSTTNVDSVPNGGFSDISD